MRIVFDIDDTILNNKNRDYDNAIPYKNVINKINQLYSEGNEIVLYTARGMKSCEGNLEKIKEKYTSQMTSWLKKNNVKYHELVFGKPLGDLYVDDKAMEVRDFLDSKFEKIHGGSNKPLYHYGRYLKKDLGSHEALIAFQRWNELKPNFMSSPHVISYLYNEVYMDWINGDILYNRINIYFLKRLIKQIIKLKEIKFNDFDINYHINKLYQHSPDINDDSLEINSKIKFCEKKLKECELYIKHNASFSHGDCILSNIIVTQKNLDQFCQFYFIDPLMNEVASSYLFDLAKIRMSLHDYEKIFNFSNYSNNYFMKDFDEEIMASNIDLEVIKVIEYMHVIRLYKYKTTRDKKKVLKLLTRLEMENGWTV